MAHRWQLHIESSFLLAAGTIGMKTQRTWKGIFHDLLAWNEHDQQIPLNVAVLQNGEPLPVPHPIPVHLDVQTVLIAFQRIIKCLAFCSLSTVGLSAVPGLRRL
jgi:hypothetical protein